MKTLFLVFRTSPPFWRFKFGASLVLGGWCLVLSSTAFGQGTAFTYQGRLNTGGTPANGSYDLTFALYNAASGGGQVGSVLTNAATAVSNGLFTATLDFGNQFPGADRWLEVAARTNGGGVFATLSPRQPLTSAPYAVRSQQAGAAGTATTVTGTVAANQLTGTILASNIAAGSISSTMLAAGSVTTAALADGAVAESKLGTVTTAQLRNTLTEPYVNAVNYGATHQFGFALCTVGPTQFAVSDPSWDDYQCGCPLCLCYQVNSTDAGRVSIYNTNGTLITVANVPFISGGALFGSSMADIGGGYLLVGAPGAGQVYFMDYNGGVVATPRNGPSSDGFGKSVGGLANGLQLIGEPYHSSVYGQGQVLVYNGGSSSPGGNIVPPPPVQGGQFGLTMVAVGPNRVMVGAPAAFGVGAVYLFDITLANIGSGGTLVTSITNPMPSTAGFGIAMTPVGNDRILIGASGGPGAAFLYSTNGTLLATFTDPASISGNGFGASVASFGPDKVLISAPSRTINGVANAGAVYVFNTNGTWVGLANNPAPVANASFGYSVLQVAGNQFVAGAFDLPNQASLGSVKFMSLDGLQYVPGLSVEPGRNVALLDANQTFSGTASFSSTLKVAGPTTFSNSVEITGNNFLHFGVGLPGQQGDAGKLAYELFTPDALDIVGAATNGGSRKIKFWAEGGATFAGPVSAPSWSGNQTNIGGSLFLDNQAEIFAKNSVGTYEGCFWPRWSDNATYLNYGTGGFIIRNNSSATTMLVQPNGNIGLNGVTPNFPLSFPDVLGDKIELWGATGGAHYGFGIQQNQLQIHTLASGDDVVFGYGQSTNLTETMRIKGNGNVGIGTASPINNLQVGNEVIYAAGYGLQVNNPVYGTDIQINNSGGIGLLLHNYAGGSATMLQIRNGPGDAPVFTAYGNGSVTAASFNPTSDRNAKENFQAVSPSEVLARVAVLPIQEWNFKADAGTRHIGPMAQDFYAAFGVGMDDKHIATVDADGVALAAIQGLNEKVEGTSQKSELRIQRLEEENADLKSRLEKLERLLTHKPTGE